MGATLAPWLYKREPASIAGTYASADSGAVWRIRRADDHYAADVSGPLVCGGASWPVRGLDADTVEIENPGNWIIVTQLAHIERDRAGNVAALSVSTGRIKTMRFERTA